MKRMLVAGCLATVAAGTLAVGVNASRDRLVVHEWGTFLAMNGANGVTLDGMYHEEHALPDFVHARSRDELRLRSSNIKGETPVIYFYADEPGQVQVEVGFPSGMWTQWYPQAEFVGPSLVQIGSLPRARDGRIRWTVQVAPSLGRQPQLPTTAADALWNYARDVDAAFVSADDTTRGGSRTEWERFIFYRGLGEAPLPLDLSAADGGRIGCGSALPEGLKHIYVLRVEGGKGAYRYLPELKCGQRLDHVMPAMDHAVPVDDFSATVSGDLAGRLVESGLYPKEARAMVNTWRASYFTSEGVRALFVLPQAWTDRFIPMKITPQPDELVRVMVGRIELLTPDRERAAETAISSLASPDSAVRERAFTLLRDQGRYVEPIVRRVMESTTDERVRMLCRQLLLTDFVTDIRTSLTDAATGGRLVHEPVFARAQLASLLRDMGLNDQATQEGERALAELALMPAPTMTDHTSRHTFRALARANEGAGRDREALKWYGEFVRFGSRYQTCSGCHELAGPRNDAFFRDWWAGRKFGELASRTGESTRLIETGEGEVAADPGSLLARIRLAYLYEGRGDSTRAQRLWAKIDPPAETRATKR
ncbi:MAG TPA: hypothetical protein VFV95_07820 [Vicinamibacterales bacterium]|nr:hypothetical protein [Vicinamibacterales bacterium]